jgi:hypothetical protein
MTMVTRLSFAKFTAAIVGQAAYINALPDEPSGPTVLL